MTAGLLRSDAVVVGGGLAGLWAALHLPGTWEVLVIDKGKGPDLGSSPWAQGGMAVAVGPEDSPELHAQDTIRAGAGACNEQVVEVLVSEAPSALEELIALGCFFDRTASDDLDLNREGGQSVARSVHAADATGREIMRVVVSEAQRVTRRIVGSATRLHVEDGRCVGVRVTTEQGELDVIGRSTLLAVGGCGALYEATTNPESASGDGLALAWEAGAALADCEFVQFHPTALGTGGLRRVLLTEALRGEGALVVDESGKRFLFDVHADGELAPRDVVARAVAERGPAFLDCRSIGADRIHERFPNIVAAIAEHGFDLAKEPVPISPAAHYFLGGAATDIDGRTTLAGLYAAGECAATSVHGANRMAGNSLTEAVVFGRRAAIAMVDDAAPLPQAPEDTDEPSAVRIVHATHWEDLRTAMTNGVGLVRSESSIAAAEKVIQDIARNTSGPLHGAAVAAELICLSARKRDESRGVHFRSDRPSPNSEWDGRHVTLRPE